MRHIGLVPFRRNRISILEELQAVSGYSGEQTPPFEYADSTISVTVQTINSHLSPDEVGMLNSGEAGSTQENNYSFKVYSIYL